MKERLLQVLFSLFILARTCNILDVLNFLLRCVNNRWGDYCNKNGQK